MNLKINPLIRIISFILSIILLFVSIVYLINVATDTRIFPLFFLSLTIIGMVLIFDGFVSYIAQFKQSSTFHFGRFLRLGFGTFLIIVGFWFQIEAIIISFLSMIFLSIALGNSFNPIIVFHKPIHNKRQRERISRK